MKLRLKSPETVRYRGILSLYSTGGGGGGLSWIRQGVTEILNVPTLKSRKSSFLLIIAKIYCGKRDADLSGLPARIIEHTLSAEELATRFPDRLQRNFRKKFINAFTSFRKHLSWMNIMSMSMPPKVMTGLS